MPSKYYIIRKSDVTEDMLNEATRVEDFTTMVVPTANVETMDDLLSELNDDYWLGGPNHSVVEGQTTLDIRLPKKAVTG